jgi:hypothetical protein
VEDSNVTLDMRGAITGCRTGGVCTTGEEPAVHTPGVYNPDRTLSSEVGLKGELLECLGNSGPTSSVVLPDLQLATLRLTVSVAVEHPHAYFVWCTGSEYFKFLLIASLFRGLNTPRRTTRRLERNFASDRTYSGLPFKVDSANAQIGADIVPARSRKRRFCVDYKFSVECK